MKMFSKDGATKIILSLMKKDSMTMKELEQDSGIEHGWTSTLINALQEKNLVIKNKEGKYKQIRLTKTGTIIGNNLVLLEESINKHVRK